MFTQTQFQTLFKYHWLTTQRLLECAGNLSEADYHSHPGYGHGSIHLLLFHILRTDRGWRVGLETGQQVAPLTPDMFPTLAVLQTGYADEQHAWEALWPTLAAEAIEETVQLTTLRGDTYTLSRWRILQHLILHGMQHHTEVAQVLTAKGQSPGDLDFIFFE